jgi:two-component system phosphate regulon response regulator PhoB
MQRQLATGSSLIYCPPSVRGIVYQFPSYQALSIQLEAGGDDQDLELPPGVTSNEDGEWVLAQFIVGDESTSIAACIVDRGDGSRLAFDDRDWQRLWNFANSKEPPSVVPSSLPPPSGDISPPPDTRVLVVDDDQETQRVLKALLDAAGHATTVASSAEDAIDRLRDMAIDLVVLDWMLPGMTGLDFCKRVRKEPPFVGLPILFLTARSASNDIVAAFEAGADDYVTKPFRVPELRARILGLLRRAKMMPHIARTR